MSVANRIIGDRCGSFLTAYCQSRSVGEQYQRPSAGLSRVKCGSRPAGGRVRVRPGAGPCLLRDGPLLAGEGFVVQLPDAGLPVSSGLLGTDERKRARGGTPLALQGKGWERAQRYGICRVADTRNGVQKTYRYRERSEAITDSTPVPATPGAARSRFADRPRRSRRQGHRCGGWDGSAASASARARNH